MVLILIVIFLLSSYKEEKDFSRISNIEKIQFNLENYYKLNRKYPQNLEELKNMKLFDGQSPDVDPNGILLDPNGAKYEYLLLNSENYKLCFYLEAGSDGYGKGKHCVGKTDQVRHNYDKVK